MPAQLIQVVLLIANTCSNLLTILLLMRFFMQWSRAPFDGSLGGFVLHLTNWLVLPLRRIVPAIRGFDSASLLAAYLLQVALVALMVSLTSAYGPFDAGMMLRIALSGLRVLLRLAIYLFIVLLIVQAMLSWFNPHAPLNRLVGRLTDPLLRPLRRIVPPISNIDLTPLIAIVLAQIVLIFV
ncbi:MAG: YggT family protein [Candidatus Accumulibacter sp.]|jgi:YggT family protein|nr:YggT family protein [Accumulibacter sp.]